VFLILFSDPILLDTKEREGSRSQGQARCRWLTPVVLATQETEIRTITDQSQPRQIIHGTLSQKTLHKKGLAEWLKVKALSPNPRTSKKKAQKTKARDIQIILYLW
jgi:hypothetical protein